GLLLWRRKNGRSGPRTPRARRKLLLMGFLGAAAPFALFSFAQLHATSGLVGLYAAMTPLLVAGLAPIFFASERVNTARITGLMLGFAGVAALMGPAALGHATHDNLIAQGAAALGSVCYAINTLIARGGARIPPIEAAAGWTLFGALL